MLYFRTQEIDPESGLFEVTQQMILRPKPLPPSCSIFFVVTGLQSPCRRRKLCLDTWCVSVCVGVWTCMGERENLIPLKARSEPGTVPGVL